VSGGWDKDYNHAERLLWQNPSQILFEIGLKIGDTLADIGCGDGFFSLAAAKIVGSQGLIYALDTNTVAITALMANAQTAGAGNIHPILSDAQELVPCPTQADVALLANVLHDFRYPLKALANVKQALKPNGNIAVIDWKKEPQQRHGPPLAKRLSQEEEAKLLRNAGFKIIMVAPTGPFHYLLLATV